MSTETQMLRELADAIDAGTVLLETIGIEQRNFDREQLDAVPDLKPTDFAIAQMKHGLTITIKTRVVQPINAVFTLPSKAERLPTRTEVDALAKEIEEWGE